jgi:hypothetical protein
MRLERISLAAALMLAAFAGCSAARRHERTSLPIRDHVVIPRRDSEEFSGDDAYEPRPTTPAERLVPLDGELPVEPRSPLPDPPSSPPGEPAPAPPALGVSRVKSVGWLRDAGARWRGNGKSGSCAPNESCSVGAWSPIHGESGPGLCADEGRVRRYRSAADCENSRAPLTGLFSGARKKLGGLFHSETQACAPEPESVFESNRRFPGQLLRRRDRGTRGCTDPMGTLLQDRCTPLIPQPEAQSSTGQDIDLPQTDSAEAPSAGLSTVPPIPDLDHSATSPAAEPDVVLPEILVPDRPELQPAEPAEAPASDPGQPATGVSYGIVDPPAWPRRPLEAPPAAPTVIQIVQPVVPIPPPVPEIAPLVIPRSK